MYCAKCGNKISEGNNFCSACGTPVKPVTQFEQSGNNQIKNVDFGYNSGATSNIDETVYSKKHFFKEELSSEGKRIKKLSKILLISSISLTSLLIAILLVEVCVMMLSDKPIWQMYRDFGWAYSYILRLILAVIFHVPSILLGHFGVKNLRTGFLVGFIICQFFANVIPLAILFETVVVRISLLLILTVLDITILVLVTKNISEYKRYLRRESNK